MLEDGLSYPTRGEWTGRLIIGSMLWLFSVFLFPLLLVYGYSFRSLRATVEGFDQPPAWDRWTGLLADGLKSLLVSLAYALVPNVVGAIVLVVLLVVAAGGDATAETGGLLAGIGIIGLLVVVLVQLVVAFLLPAALVTFAAEDSARAAFSLGTVGSFALSGEYLLALLQSAFVLTFASIVGATGILLPAALFWAGVALARVFGRAYRKQMRDNTSGNRTTPDRDEEPDVGDPAAGDGSTTDGTGADDDADDQTTPDASTAGPAAGSWGGDGTDDSRSSTGTAGRRDEGSSGGGRRSGESGGDRRRSGGSTGGDRRSTSGQSDGGRRSGGGRSGDVRDSHGSNRNSRSSGGNRRSGTGQSGDRGSSRDAGGRSSEESNRRSGDSAGTGTGRRRSGGDGDRRSDDRTGRRDADEDPIGDPNRAGDDDPLGGAPRSSDSEDDDDERLE